MGRRAKSVEIELVQAKGVQNANKTAKETASIFDTQMLEQRKQRGKKKVKQEETVQPTSSEPQWWQNPFPKKISLLQNTPNTFMLV